MDRRQDILDDLSALLDGELSAADTLRAQDAAAERAEVAEDLRRLSETRRLLRQLPRRRAGEAFADRVVAEALRRGLLKERNRATVWLKRLGAAVVLALAVGVGAIVYPMIGPKGDRKPAASGGAEPAHVLVVAAEAPARHELAFKAAAPAAPIYAPGKGGRAEGPAPAEGTRAKPAARPHTLDPAQVASAERAARLLELEEKLDARLGVELQGPADGSVRQVELVVGDLAAARREVEAILAKVPALEGKSAGRRGGTSRQLDSPADEAAGPGVAFHLRPKGDHVLCYYVAAAPDQLERIAAAVGRLRTVAGEDRARRFRYSADSVLAQTRPAPGSAPRPAATAPAKPKPPEPRPAPEPYGVADLHRMSQQRASIPKGPPGAEPAPAAPAAPAAPRLLVIQLRADPAAHADLDPGRNVRP